MGPLVDHRVTMPILLDDHYRDRNNKDEARREHEPAPVRSSGWTIPPLVPRRYVVRHLAIILQPTLHLRSGIAHWSARSANLEFVYPLSDLASSPVRHPGSPPVPIS